MALLSSHHLSLAFAATKLFSPFPLSLPKRNPSLIAASPSPPSSAAQAVAQAESNNCLPCVRTYENDIARLSLTGFSSFQQALSAASADGGQAATEHIDAGLDVMVLETVFPGHSDDRSTVSTRLFLPPRKVKEKARRLRKSVPKDIFSGSSSENILAMTFRQVVVQQRLNFDLAVFVPGSQRNVEDLGSEREVTVSFTLSSSDESVISGIAETVCILALETTQREFQHASRGTVPFSFFNWFSKTKKFASKDSSVILYKFEDDVIIENAKSLLDMFNSSRADYTRKNTKPTTSAWTSAMHDKLENIGGWEFSKWTSEHVPAYRLEINVNGLTNINFEGLKNASGNKWEVPLTHSQMVALADVLDMYFEDIYTLPSKQLSCDIISNTNRLLQNKSGSSLLGFVKKTVAVAILLISVGVMVQLCLPHLYISKRRNHAVFHVLSSSENHYEKVHPVMLEASQMEASCCALVRKLKDSYGWNGDVKFNPSIGASIGEIPASLSNDVVADPTRQDVSVSSAVLVTSDDVLKSPFQEIASYQVVMSTDGRIVGFQPTSGVAVNHWAAHPIAKELYGGMELSPGLLEPGLNIKKPENVIVMELLTSLSEDDCFALARPVQ